MLKITVVIVQTVECGLRRTPHIIVHSHFSLILLHEHFQYYGLCLHVIWFQCINWAAQDEVEGAFMVSWWSKNQRQINRNVFQWSWLNLSGSSHGTNSKLPNLLVLEILPDWDGLFYWCLGPRKEIQFWVHVFHLQLTRSSFVGTPELERIFSIVGGWGNKLPECSNHTRKTQKQYLCLGYSFFP